MVLWELNHIKCTADQTADGCSECEHSYPKSVGTVHHIKGICGSSLGELVFRDRIAHLNIWMRMNKNGNSKVQTVPSFRAH